MKCETREIRGPDGRRLTAWVAGEGDEVLFTHSGTPEDGALLPDTLKVAAERELKCVGYSRPGYRSDRHPGRRVVDCADDVAAIVDALGIESFTTVGWSCGGLHALVCAVHLPNRVKAVATVGANAPRRAPGLKWTKDMARENQEEFAAAESGLSATRKYVAIEAPKWRTAKPDDVLDLLGGRLTNEERDKMTLDEKKSIVKVMRNALELGIWGWVDDNLASVGDCGFDPARIEVPVAIWHGGEDRFVPAAHAEWLGNNIPGAELHLKHEDSHLSMSKHFPEILDDLLAIAHR